MYDTYLYSNDCPCQVSDARFAESHDNRSGSVGYPPSDAQSVLHADGGRQVDTLAQQ